MRDPSMAGHGSALTKRRSEKSPIRNFLSLICLLPSPTRWNPTRPTGAYLSHKNRVEAREFVKTMCLNKQVTVRTEGQDEHGH